MALFIPPVVRATDANNAALSGAKWYFYASGGLSPQSVYADDGLVTAHANPVVADSGGLFAPIYLNPAVTYRAILKDAAGNEIEDVDPYTSPDAVLDETTVSTAPTTGDWDQIDTAFTGDLSKVRLAFKRTISGTDTLGSPTTGYEFTPETAGIVGYVLNQSGHNEATDGNIGRTSANFGYVKLDNQGQGDLVGFTFESFVNGARPGATHFLASPAVTMINGTMTAGADGVYLNPVEVDLQLGSFDAAAIGHVASITRNAGDTAGGLSALTAGYRSQSKGTYPIDAGLSLNGPTKVGVDGTPATFPTNKAFAAMKSGDRIYGAAASSDGLKATSLGASYMQSNAAGFEFTQIGFTTGVGGTVTQATSKATGVTLNKVCGQITTHNAALAANTTATFTVTNSAVAATDIVTVNLVSGNATAGTYQVWIEAIAAGSFKVNVRNISAGSLGEALILNFAVLKAVAA